MAKDLTDALAALTEQAQGITSRRDKKLPADKNPDPIPSRTGTPKANSPSSSGAIASPLTETAYVDRQFYTTMSLPTTDGILWARVRPVKMIKFEDANESIVVMNYKAPV